MCVYAVCMSAFFSSSSPVGPFSIHVPYSLEQYQRVTMREKVVL